MTERIVELLIVLLTLVGAGGASRDVSQHPPSTDDVEAAALDSRDSDSDDSDSDSDPEAGRVDPGSRLGHQVPRDVPEAPNLADAGITLDAASAYEAAYLAISTYWFDSPRNDGMSSLPKWTK